MENNQQKDIDFIIHRSSDNSFYLLIAAKARKQAPSLSKQLFNGSPGQVLHYVASVYDPHLFRLSESL